MKPSLLGASKYLFAGTAITPFLINDKEFVKKVLLNKQLTVNECADMKTHMQEEVQDLDKIFTEGGHMLDQHEMMEMMQKGKDNL